jgi:hypothetical protein
MGDPAAIGDSEGEYLELINLDDDSIRIDTLLVIIDSEDTLLLMSLSLAPRQLFLVCKDSAVLSGYGTPCDMQWTGLGIANTRDVEVTVIHGTAAMTFNISSPLNGKSWENTLDSARSFNQFMEPQQQWINGDLGSPGLMFSGSRLPLNHDLALLSINLDTSQSSQPALNIVIENRGLESVSSASLAVSQDRDWDGIGERELDSQNLSFQSLPTGQIHVFSWDIPPAESGIFIVTLAQDENIFNNRAEFFYHPTPSLQLTEVCPNSPEEFPEWIEIKNISSHSISLKNIQYNTIAVDEDPLAPPSLRPGEFAVLTEDKEQFEETHGALNLTLVELGSWDILKNTGDTVMISVFDSIEIDRMEYGSLSTADKGKCLVRDQYAEDEWLLTEYRTEETSQQEASTPGFQSQQDSVFSWSLSSKLIDISKPRSHFMIEIHSPPATQYTVKVFDLSGYEVNRLCDKCTGTQSLAWYGKDGSGRTLPIGPYIIWVKAGGKSPSRKAVILAKPL